MEPLQRAAASSARPRTNPGELRRLLEHSNEIAEKKKWAKTMPQKRSGGQYARGTEQRKRRVRFQQISIVRIINICQLRDGCRIVEDPAAWMLAGRRDPVPTASTDYEYLENYEIFYKIS